MAEELDQATTPTQNDSVGAAGEGKNPTPNPNDGTQATDGGVQERHEAAPADADGKRAQPARTQADVDRDALALLDEGKSVDDVRKVVRAPEPKADADQKGEGEGSSRSAGQRSAVPPEKGATYEGLDDKARQALSQAHLLPDQDSWNQMPAPYRDALQQSAREIVAARTRDFQRQQQNGRDDKGRFASDSTRAADAAEPPDSTLKEATAGTRDAGHAQQQRQEQGTAPATPPGQQLPKGWDKLKKVTDDLGDDIGKPMLEGLQEILNPLQQENQQLRQQLAQTQQQSQYAMQQQIKSEEANARVELAKHDPALATDNARWEAVKANGRVFAQAAFNSGQQFTWEDSLLKAGRALMTPDIQQNAQRQLAAKRQDSLARTPERGGAETMPNRARTAADRDRLALEALDSGKRVEDVIAELT